MTVSFYRHAWGAVGADATWQSLDALVYAAAEEGYDGVEVTFGDVARGPAGFTQTEIDLRNALQKTGLRLFPLLQTSANPRDDVAAHLSSFRSLLQWAQTFGATQAAVHAGVDSFNDAAAIQFFRDATLMARDMGIEPFYETHRGRPMYNPYRTATILEALPELWLTGDIAHWIPVVERIPYDLEEIFTLCASRTAHIHTRVGFEEGPQVPDPRDSHWAAQLEFHEQWWDQCVAAARQRGAEIGITPEFGPHPFTVFHPNSRDPLVNLDEIVSWMYQRMRNRYLDS